MKIYIETKEQDVHTSVQDIDNYDMIGFALMISELEIQKLKLIAMYDKLFKEDEKENYEIK